MKLDNVNKIAVVGTGMIGTSLAVLFTGHGYKTCLYALNEELAEESKNRYQEYYQELIQKGLVTDAQAAICEKYLSYTTSYADIADADFVFECSLEDVKVKHEVYKELDKVLVAPKAVISTTSALSVEDLADGIDKFKDKLIVAHPFFPPHLVPFFEVVKSHATADGVTESAVELLESADREVVVLKKNAPGFIANRLQHALFREAINIVEQGIADARSVDKGTISPLSGFENYQKIYDEINEKVVGIKTSEGTAVTRQSKHFMDRVIGTMKDPKTGRSRSGVTVEGIRDALENPAKVFPTRTDPDSRKSQKYIGRHGTVSLDPETGILIQCNPTDADYVRRIANGNAKI